MSCQTRSYRAIVASLILISSSFTGTAFASPDKGDEIDAENMLQAGTYSNEEEVYFANDKGETAAPWLSYRVAENKDDGYQLMPVDMFGNRVEDRPAISLTRDGGDYIVTRPLCSKLQDAGAQECSIVHSINDIDGSGMTLRLVDGTDTRLNLARNVECWAAIPKEQPKADGSTDWHFDAKLLLHDQGGRAVAGGRDTGAPETILRMRKVYWPAPSSNRPSLVLYIHKSDEPDKAVSYSWADIDATRIGINLRWMQASCTVIGAERGSEVSETNFRG